MSTYNKMYFVLAIGIATAISFSNAGCAKHKDPWESVPGGKVKVLVSFAPLYCFTTAVADKDAKVQTLLDTNGPHEHTPTSADAHLASGADLFLVNGLGLDEFVTKVADSSGNKKIKIVEIAEDGIPENKRLRMGEHEHGTSKDKDHDKDKGKDHDHDAVKGGDKEKEQAKGKDHEHEHDKAKDKDQEKAKGKEHGHAHEHGEWDPHAWLGIEQAILMVEKVRDTLKEADPSHKADYDKRAAEYIDKIKKLHEEGKKMLADKKNRKLIAMHDSLGYFCKSFDLDLVDSVMSQPGVDADLKKLGELAKECEEKNIHILAVEPQYSKERAKTLRDNLRSQNHELIIVEIDPLETAPRAELGPDYYLKVMQRNLDALAKSMK
jgi:zinc transport system substrate-binding protein